MQFLRVPVNDAVSPVRAGAMRARTSRGTIERMGSDDQTRAQLSTEAEKETHLAGVNEKKCIKRSRFSGNESLEGETCRFTCARTLKAQPWAQRRHAATVSAVHAARESM